MASCSSTHCFDQGLTKTKVAFWCLLLWESCVFGLHVWWVLYYNALMCVTGHVRGHLGLSPYKCNLCSYSSADKSTLIRHLRTHNGERPFQCLVCDFAFTTKANCERHVRWVSCVLGRYIAFVYSICIMNVHVLRTRMHDLCDYICLQKCANSCHLSALMLTCACIQLHHEY